MLQITNLLLVVCVCGIIVWMPQLEAQQRQERTDGPPPTRSRPLQPAAGDVGRSEGRQVERGGAVATVQVYSRQSRGPTALLRASHAEIEGPETTLSKVAAALTGDAAAHTGATELLLVTDEGAGQSKAIRVRALSARLLLEALFDAGWAVASQSAASSDGTSGDPLWVVSYVLTRPDG
eukprot:COSAG04_NODE_702_length_11009_cov_109.493217_3_plen_179_part_00